MGFNPLRYSIRLKLHPGKIPGSAPAKKRSGLVRSKEVDMKYILWEAVSTHFEVDFPMVSEDR
jgi:hypothetical protein